MSLDSVVENVWARGFARYVLPVAGIVVVGSTGWIVDWGVGEITRTLELHGAKIDAAATRAGEAVKELKSLRNESLLRFEDTGRRVGEIGAKMDKFDDRLRVLEIKVRP